MDRHGLKELHPCAKQGCAKKAVPGQISELKASKTKFFKLLIPKFASQICAPTPIILKIYFFALL